MSSRCVLILAYAEWNTANTAQRFSNEVRIHNRLRRAGVNVVPLVGVYSTEALPFGLVYEYMEGSNLKQYLKNKPITERLKLVIAPLYSPRYRSSNASR